MIKKDKGEYWTLQSQIDRRVELLGEYKKRTEDVRMVFADADGFITIPLTVKQISECDSEQFKLLLETELAIARMR